MTFFPEPLRPSEGRQDDEYHVNPIEADRNPKEPFQIEEEERKKRVNLYGAFLVYFNKLINQFDTSSEGTEKAISDKEAAKAKKLADAEAKKKLIAEKRKALLKKREEKRRLLREKKEALRKKKEQEKKDKNNN